MKKLSEIEHPLIYLTGYGFEDRTTAVANYLMKYYGDTKNLFNFALSFGDPSSEIGRSNKWRENKYILDEFLSRYAVKYYRVATSIRNPIDIIFHFRKALDKNNIEIEKSFTIIDITSFPKATLLVILNELFTRNARGILYYVKPKDYELPLSIGAEYHGLLPFYGRYYNPEKKRILWIILGFEGHRAHAVLNNIEPAETICFIGDTPNGSEKWKEITRKENELTLLSPKVKEDSISYYKINEAIKKLEKVYKSYENENIIIAPLGTKLSTVSLAYFARGRQNVFIAFSSSKREAEHQSIGSEILFCIEFDNLKVGIEERLLL